MLSAGVISDFGRVFQSEDTGLAVEGLIQIDAAVSPGNLGGPLLNSNGQVIGIVTFASIAQLVQAPTTDPEELESTVLSLTTGHGTAIGKFSQSAGAADELEAQAGATATPIAEDEYQLDIIRLGGILGCVLTGYAAQSVGTTPTLIAVGLLAASGLCHRSAEAPSRTEKTSPVELQPAAA